MTTKAPRTAPARRGISDQLCDAIGADGRTAYALGRDSGVDPGVIQRFLNGERDVRLGTADRLAAALGLRLVEAAARTRGRPRRDRGKASADALPEETAAEPDLTPPPSEGD